MNPELYCQQRADASLPQFAITQIFLDETVRPKLIALYALSVELMELPYKVNDEGVASVKLQWWYQQLQQAFLGKADHPVLLVLQQYLSECHSTDFDQIVAGIHTEIGQFNVNTHEELWMHSLLIGGSFAKIEARLSGIHDEAVLHQAQNLGAISYLCRQLAHLSHSFSLNKIMLPFEDMARHQLSRKNMMDIKSSDSVNALLNEQVDRLVQRYEKSLHSLNVDASRRLRHLLIRVHLDIRRLNQVKSLGQRLFWEIIPNPVVTDVFYAWLRARRINKG